MKNFVNGLYQLQLSGVDFLINKKIVKTNWFFNPYFQ
jgi:hypothetical protein